MKNRRSTPATPAEAATVAGNSLPPAQVDIGPIPEAEFRKIIQSSQQGDLTKSYHDRLIAERQRLTSKRKDSVVAGKPVEAASASSREQEIVRMSDPYVRSAVETQQGRKAGGRKTAEQKRQQGEETRLAVHAHAKRLLSTHASHEVSAIIAQSMGLSRNQVLEHLRDHPSGNWKKKVT